jgi:saccharopine dehydrogenase-like NADP-dependent oxidoreductase
MARKSARNGNGNGNGSGQGPLLIVGGYGLVGQQAARLLRQRHPGLPIVLGGRNPERAKSLADAIGARAVAIDVTHEQPLAALAERPAAVLAVVSDPRDYLLADAMRAGIPIADINRAGHASILDAVVAAARERPAAAVLLSGSWMAGVSALAAAAAVGELGGARRVDITALASSDDRVGPDSWGFSERLAWPYYAMRDGSRQPAHPMTSVRQVRCADRVVRPAALVGTLEQTTLPITLGVPTVETRMALQSKASLYGLVTLKRSGALRGLARPALRRTRTALLQSEGAGDFAGLTVTAHGLAGSASVDLLDTRGQSHLSAVGAASAAERVLASVLPAGISFPEQSADPRADLEMLRQAGVQVRLTGFANGLLNYIPTVNALREVIVQP